VDRVALAAIDPQRAHAIEDLRALDAFGDGAREIGDGRRLGDLEAYRPRRDRRAEGVKRLRQRIARSTTQRSIVPMR
jgi:hypothetical protein